MRKYWYVFTITPFPLSVELTGAQFTAKVPAEIETPIYQVWLRLKSSYPAHQVSFPKLISTYLDGDFREEPLSSDVAKQFASPSKMGLKYV